MSDEKARNEIERITDLLNECGVSERRIRMLEPVIENTAWMKAKLDESRQLVQQSAIVISYDNGGGQKGLRENPIFKGYEALFKSYMNGMDRILNALPSEEAKAAVVEELKPQSMLDVVRNRRKAT